MNNKNNKYDEIDKNSLLKEKVIRETFFDDFLDKEIDIKDYQKNKKIFHITIFKQQYLEIQWIITKKDANLYKLNIYSNEENKDSEISLKIPSKNENENKTKTNEINISNINEKRIITKFSRNYIEISKDYSVDNDNYNFERYLIQLIYLFSCQAKLIEFNNKLSKIKNKKYQIDNLYQKIVNFYWDKINRKIIYPLSKYHYYYREILQYIDLENQANSLLNRAKNIYDQNNNDKNKKFTRVIKTWSVMITLINLAGMIISILISLNIIKI